MYLCFKSSLITVHNPTETYFYLMTALKIGIKLRDSLNVLRQQVPEQSPGNFYFFSPFKYFPMQTCLQGISTAYLKLFQNYVLTIYISAVYKSGVFN